MIVGLVYKAGTNTLRGSHALQLARKLEKEGYQVNCYDPALKGSKTHLVPNLLVSLHSLRGVSACVAPNIRPDLLKQADWQQLMQASKGPLFFDAGGSFAPVLGSLPTYRSPFLAPHQATQE